MTGRRFPLWTTMIPLLLGIAIWFWLWNGYRQDFAAALGAWLPGDTVIATGGFPYRLQAEVAPLRLDHQGDALLAQLAAELAVANRVPWQADRTVFNLKEPRLRLELASLSGAWLAVDSNAAQSSLRTDEARIARLSVVWEVARLTSGLLGVPMTADTLEAHLRETPAAVEGATAGPRLPTQDQFVMTGTGVRLAEGDPLTLAADFEVTGAGAIRSLASWKNGGTLELRALTLADPTGEVARITGTIVPDGIGALRMAGTVETVCPASVRAAAAGSAPVLEKRARRPVTIAFTGNLPGALELEPADPERPLPPVRAQEPDCPRLR